MRRLTVLVASGLVAGCIPQTSGPPDSRPLPPPPSYPRDRTPPPRDEVPYERQPLGNGVSALPAPPPAWEARPVTPDARTIPTSDYVVQPGDTLRRIAETTGAGLEAIARANDLPPPYVIRSGQRLTIPGGRYHLVRKGETGIAIARAYGVDWSRIVTANALAEPYILRVGQRVVIPGDGTPSASERAAAFRLDIDDLLTGSEPAIAKTEKPAKAVTSPTRTLPASVAVSTPTAAPGRFVWPVRGGTIVRRFGPGASGERNDGIKIATPLDTPIVAAADGTVAYVGSAIPALGGLVILKHGTNVTTVYGHASSLLVKRGQAVKRGQTVALSGNSGFADRPEVHFEIRQGRTPVDPLSRLPAR